MPFVERTETVYRLWHFSPFQKVRNKSGYLIGYLVFLKRIGNTMIAKSSGSFDEIYIMQRFDTYSSLSAPE